VKSLSAELSMPIENAYPHLSSHHPPTKLLSILCQGRNDSYMGNFLWRLSTVLNNFARNLKILGMENQVEVIITDWGSQVPLWKSLQLSSDARKNSRFIVVPPELSKIYELDSIYPASYPANTAARRASGEYLLHSDADAFMPLDSLCRLLYCLKVGRVNDYSLDDSFFWASKYHIPNTLIEMNPSLDAIEEHISKNWQNYVREGVNKELFQGSGVCLLMKREMWFETRGWNEKLIYWGWNDIDWHTRLASKYRWEDLELQGMKVFHLEHYKDRFGDYTKELQRKFNDPVPPTCIAPNPENWGLADHYLQYYNGDGVNITPSSNRQIISNEVLNIIL